MDMNQTVAQRQTHKLVLTSVMKQSLQILQMSQQDLSDFVHTELKSNPLLELDTVSADFNDDFAPIPIPENSENEKFPEEHEAGASVELLPYIGDEAFHTRGQSDSELSPLLFARRDEDFYDMLRAQINVMQLPTEVAMLCCYLVDCLNRRGYLEYFPEEISADLGLSLFDVIQALYLLQSLHPIGVGARTLQECLMLQLVQGKDFNEYTIAIINKGLTLLGANKITALAELLGIDYATAQKACAAIRVLNPVPLRGYSTGERAVNIIPGAIVKKEGNHFSLQMTSSFVPRLTLNQTYCALAETDKITVNYINENRSKAQQLLRSIDDRQKTLYRVIESVITLQPDFFATGEHCCRWQ